MDQPTILAPGEPHPVLTRRESGISPIVLISDHAGLRIPARLGSLGLADSALRRHIGWDIGIWAVTELLSDALDAVAIGQAYSRLVIDNNRPTDVPGSIPIISETTEIPGNTGIAEAERAARYGEIMRPYHERIAAELDRRMGQPVFLISMHSFTPVYMGISRPWHIGTLYHRDSPARSAPCSICCGPSPALSWAITSHMRSRTSRITAFPCMARPAACRMWGWRFARI